MRACPTASACPRLWRQQTGAQSSCGLPCSFTVSQAAAQHGLRWLMFMVSPTAWRDGSAPYASCTRACPETGSRRCARSRDCRRCDQSVFVERRTDAASSACARELNHPASPGRPTTYGGNEGIPHNRSDARNDASHAADRSRRSLAHWMVGLHLVGFLIGTGMSVARESLAEEDLLLGNVLPEAAAARVGG
jgi:hypothetical protein